MEKLSPINQKFIEAAQNNQLEKLKNLLNQELDIHAYDDYALRIASYKGHLEIVKYLLTQGANIHASSDGALRFSATNGHLETVKFLIENGANIHANDDEALIYSARLGQLETVKFLLTQGANIHANDDKALKEAAKNERYDMWKVLSAFIQEQKLLVAALGSMPLVAASDYMLQELSSVGSAPKTKRPSITKTKRSKI